MFFVCLWTQKSFGNENNKSKQAKQIFIFILFFNFTPFLPTNNREQSNKEPTVTTKALNLKIYYFDATQQVFGVF